MYRWSMNTASWIRHMRARHRQHHSRACACQHAVKVLHRCHWSLVEELALLCGLLTAVQGCHRRGW